MRFAFDHDSGDQIDFWITPDNPLSVPRVVVSADGRPAGSFEAGIVDGGLVAQGLHATGQCRFRLTETDIPGLSAIPQLEMRDADTNVLVFRRAPRETLVQQRIVLIGTSVMPETALQSALYPHFQYSAFGLQTLSDEILNSIFSLRVESQLLSGTILVPRYNGHFMYGGALSTILVRDPYVEMATRMFWLKAQAPTALDPNHGWRLGIRREAAAFADDFDYADLRGLRRFFRMMPEGAYRLLYNPLTRQLATMAPDDQLNPAYSMIGADMLSRFDIVGHRTHYEAFALSLFDRLGVHEEVPTPEPIPKAVTDLADRLRRVKEVGEMLVFDAALSDAVLSSVSKSWRG